MTLLKIARLGHPVLRRRADPVGTPDAETRRLADDMLATMHDAKGVGLAAPQVHVPLRLIVWQVPAGRGEPTEPRVLVDPVLTPRGDEREDGFEGCLSIPGLRGVVSRHRRVSWRGADLDGAPVAGEATGFEARVLQHEVDHLDGVLYLDRMDLTRLTFEDELENFLAAQAWR